MKKQLIITPILILTGTIGLLLNEFLLHLGRPATLIFAGISSFGFIILVTCLWDRNGKNVENS